MILLGELFDDYRPFRPARGRLRSGDASRSAKQPPLDFSLDIEAGAFALIVQPVTGTGDILHAYATRGLRAPPTAIGDC